MKGTNMDAFGVSKREGKKKTYEPSSGNPSGSRRVAHYLVPGPHTLATSMPGHRLGNLARDQLYGTAAAAPGLVFGAGGAALAGKHIVSGMKEGNTALGAASTLHRAPKGKTALAMMGIGAVGAGIGQKAGRQHALTEMNRKGTLKKEVHKSNTVSAFGVDHNEEISKFSLKPVTQGFKALKFGNAKTLPKTMGTSYKKGIATGQGKFNSAVNAAAVGVKHSPGIAGAGAGLGATAIGGTGYAMGRRKD